MPSGSHIVQIEAGTTTPLVTQTITLTSATSYTIAVEPSFASTSLTIRLLTEDNSAPTSGDFKLRIFNASPEFGNVDVYITGPDEGIRGATPSVSNLAFQAGSSYQSLTAGSYEVYFSVAGQGVISVDSGQLTFTAGQVRTLVLLDNFGSGFTSALLADLN